MAENDYIGEEKSSSSSHENFENLSEIQYGMSQSCENSKKN